MHVLKLFLGFILMPQEQLNLLKKAVQASLYYTDRFPFYVCTWLEALGHI